MIRSRGRYWKNQKHLVKNTWIEEDVVFRIFETIWVNIAKVEENIVIRKVKKNWTHTTWLEEEIVILENSRKSGKN